MTLRSAPHVLTRVCVRTCACARVRMHERACACVYVCLSHAAAGTGLRPAPGAARVRGGLAAWGSPPAGVLAPLGPWGAGDAVVTEVAPECLCVTGGRQRRTRMGSRAVSATEENLNVTDSVLGSGGRAQHAGHGDARGRTGGSAGAEGVRGRPGQSFLGVGRARQGQGSSSGLASLSAPGAAGHRGWLPRHAGQGDSGLVLRAGRGGGLPCGLREGVDDFGHQRGPVTPEGEQLQTQALGKLSSAGLRFACGDRDFPRPRVRARAPLPHLWLPASQLQTEASWQGPPCLRAHKWAGERGPLMPVGSDARGPAMSGDCPAAWGVGAC